MVSVSASFAEDPGGSSALRMDLVGDTISVSGRGHDVDSRGSVGGQVNPRCPSSAVDGRPSFGPWRDPEAQPRSDRTYFVACSGVLSRLEFDPASAQSQFVFLFLRRRMIC